MAEQSLVATGIEGLDQILGGGFNSARTFLIQGQSGTGKTTLGLQFLLEGIRRGEKVLYVTLSETGDELAQAASSHGWSLDGIVVQDLTGNDETRQEQQTVFPSSEIELAEVTEEIIDRFQEVKPQRTVIDSVTQIRLVAESPVRYRRQLLALKQLFHESDCTVLLLNNDIPEGDAHIHSLVHGIIQLERYTPDYGQVRRQLQIEKMRAAVVTSGYHDYRIRTGGLEVYPQITRLAEQEYQALESMSSGFEALDTLVGGGLERGTSCLIMGQSGTGKSTVASAYVYAAAQRGEASAVYLFDEREETYMQRARGLGFPLDSFVESGLLHIEMLDAGQVTAGEFSYLVRKSVEDNDAHIIVVDSLTGYLNAMIDSRLELVHIHELLIYLSRMGVLSIVVLTQHGIVGDHPIGPVDASYIADTVLLLRRFEALGTVRQALSVVKKRQGYHEHTIREIRLSSAHGMMVGEPLNAFQGVLSGAPRYQGDVTELYETFDDES